MRFRTYTGPRTADSARSADQALPPALPYPNGWFCVGFSREWALGQVRTRPLMDQEIVVYRTRRGTLRATRPYCPHLGAHLGVGGTVDGENLVCPFHGFAFGPDGTCIHTPYGTPPKTASLTLLPVQEKYGIVWAWHHHDDAPPTWELPRLSTVGIHPPVCWTIDLVGHPQEVTENVVDYGHGPQLHGFTPFEILVPFTTDGALASVHARTGRKLPLLGTTVAHPFDMTMIGLGGFHALFDLSRFGFRASYWALATPTGPWRFRLWTAATSARCGGTRPAAALDRRLAHGVSALVVLWAAKDLHSDFAIWHHKQYLPHPKLNGGDGPIGEYRYWARQFYPPGSAPLRPEPVPGTSAMLPGTARTNSAT